MTNAGTKQNVIIVPPSGEDDLAKFKGQGEGNVPMTLKTQGFLKTSSNGWPYFTVPGNSSQSSTYHVTCLSDGKPVNALLGVGGNPLTPVGGNVYIAVVMSESGGAKDYNDTATYFTAWETP
ncbi:MAG TPA: hypothetical protein VKB93_27945 [Thermoanaerobaculia bacterium]|nr:hypothetical protein [Thermoanaerobaculia bacterium]